MCVFACACVRARARACVCVVGQGRLDLLKKYPLIDRT